MAKNKYGVLLDSNGYAPSVLQDDLTECYRCGRSCEKLDRHEIFGGPFREKSKALGLWVMLCHQSCHLDGVHADAKEANRFRMKAQRVAIKKYKWTTEQFISEFGKNYL